MKKWLKIVVIVFFVVFLAIQLHRPARINPEINPAEEIVALPETVDSIMKISCNDCHSNKTDWRWYSNISPISWEMVDHVTEGRQNLNFSIWNTYEAEKKDRKLEEICEQIDTREMPLPSYLRVHWGAKLSDEQIKTVCNWTETEREKLKASL